MEQASVLIERLLPYVEARNWYAVAALLIGFFVYSWKRWLPQVWDLIPPRWRFAVPLGLGAGTGFVSAFQEGLTWDSAVVRAVVVAFFGGLTASGGHHALADLPGPYGRKK